MDEKEMLFGDPKSAALFYEIIDKRVAMVFKQLGFDKTYSATVMAVSLGKADIRLQGGTNTITGVPNKTGDTLTVGNEVYVEAINNSLNNLVIKYKK